MKFERFLWSMPLVYALHITEEYAAGFPSWMTHHLHASMDNAGFLLNNGLFMVILVALSLWASRSRSWLSAFLFMSWSSAHLFWNFIFHLATTLYADSYSPGLVSASLLYYPIALWTVVLAIKGGRLRVPAVVAAFGIGACLMLFVIWAGLLHFHLPTA